MRKNKRAKEQSTESTELNEDQLDTVSGGYVAHYTERWYVGHC